MRANTLFGVCCRSSLLLALAAGCTSTISDDNVRLNGSGGTSPKGDTSGGNGTLPRAEGGSFGVGGTVGATSGASSVPGRGGSSATSSGGAAGSGANPIAGSNGQNIGSGGSSATASTDLPCDVQRVVNASCATCHGNVPSFGAPMSLMHAADFRKPASTGTDTVGQRAIARINDDSRPMPPPPNARLSDADRNVLQQWVSAGSPSGSCSGGQSSGGSGGAGGSGGTSTKSTPPDVTCYRITARQSAANDKYMVPTTPDFYQCFDYDPPWGSKKVQVVSAQPIIDNSRVIHHWILYNTPGSVTNGAHAGCSGAHPNAAFIVGWAPGGNGLDLPDDVGLRTEGGGFSLETHYNNTTGGAEPDASGVEICVTEKLRPKEAAVHWLGTQNLNKINATGTCVPVNTGPVTILSSAPHMHLQGRHMKTVINRKGGATETLIDVPFDFNTQISYPTPAVINPGDTLTTTCTYATPTPFGQGTMEEMCYNFVIAYPAGQLGQLIQLLRKYDCTG